MLKTKKSNENVQQGSSAVLKKAQKNITRQAVLAALMVFLTVVIMFAITAAWYTNIAQTSGLIFEVEQWGFTGNVSVASEAMEAAPGDTGVIGLNAENNSDSITAVSVNISKATMDEEIQKRIYFYVDTTRSRNGESMNRVYLSNTESYTYTLFSQGTLALSESVYNDAQLKWQWVYDVLGYYVLGTENEDGSILISEYLRPIEYEYDPAGTTFSKEATEADGKEIITYTTLETIDGEITVMEFLSELFSTDGYPSDYNETTGEIVLPIANAAGYYPVDVDEEGYGVWAYLCTYSEIELNTIYDTQLAQTAAEAAEKGEKAATYEAKLTVSAQNSKIEAVEVSTAAALRSALGLTQAEEGEEGNGAGESVAVGETVVIQLAADITLNEALEIGNMQQVMIDLNGHTLQLPEGDYNSGDVGISLDTGSALTVYNGRVTGSGAYAFSTNGAELTLSAVTITGVDCALTVLDNENKNGVDSKIRMVGCTIETAEEAIYIRGNGTASAQTTQLVVENSSIVSGYIGIMGNGTADGDAQWGTDIQIIGSAISGKWAGVYQPQKNSTLTISADSNGTSSLISGYTGLAIKGGTVRITDSTVTGTGEKKEPSEQPSGFSDTGDGIYIETNYGYEIVLEIGGSSDVSSTYGYALQVYEEGAENVSVSISAGRFSTDVSKYFAENANYAGLDENGYTVASSEYWAAMTETEEQADAEADADASEEQSDSEADTQTDDDRQTEAPANADEQAEPSTETESEAGAEVETGTEAGTESAAGESGADEQISTGEEENSGEE